MAGVLGELTDKFGFKRNRTQAWGDLEGLWFRVSLPASVSDSLTIRTVVRFPDDKARALVSDGFTKIMDISAKALAECRGNEVTLSVRSYGGIGGEFIVAMLYRLVALLKRAGAEPLCAHCQQAAPIGFASQDGRMVKLCAGCGGAAPAPQQEQKTPPWNGYLTGTAGAVLGAALGSLVWVAIGLLGYPAAIGGLAIAVFAARGYELLHGRLTKPGVAIVAAVCVAAVLALLFLSKTFIPLNLLFAAAFLGLGGYLVTKIRRNRRGG